MTDLNKNVYELKHKISNLEYDVNDAMEQRYIKFAVESKDAASLLVTAHMYSNQINDLISRIDNQIKREVVDSLFDLNMFKSTLEESKNSLVITEQVLSASMYLSSGSQTKLSLAERIRNIQTTNEILSNKHLSTLNVYKYLMREHLRITNVLHSNCLTTWKKHIQWIENDTDVQESWKLMLKMSANSQEDVCDIILALQYFDSLNIEVKLFSDKLINLIVKPIIIEHLQVDITKSIHASIITLKVSKIKDESLSTIIRKLKDVFEFLNSSLPVDFNDIHIMSYLGSYASEQFCNIFKDKALFNAVPNKYSKLNSFQHDLNEVLELNTYLDGLGFFEKSNDELIQYTENIDSLFFTKISQLYYDKAKTILIKDLHDLVEVNNENKWTDENVIENSGFYQTLFVYPQIKVSKSLLEFLNLIDEVASEMSSIPENNAWRYHDILNNIIIMFCDMVPNQNCKTSELHPQQSAVLYNNIMYFSRKLAEMSSTYKNILIVHLLEKLKNLASEILHSQCNQQIVQIEKNFNQSYIIEIGMNSNLGYFIEKSVSECYNLLFILSSLWKDILPSTVYCKFIGYLCNALFECIFIKLFALEDISATSAEQYSSIFNKLIKDILTLFPEPNEVHRYIPKWWVLNELIYILSSNIIDIQNRWADGKGPLANELKVEQIKCMLKALFQNTDRREALLKHISATAQS